MTDAAPPCGYGVTRNGERAPCGLPSTHQVIASLVGASTPEVDQCMCEAHVFISCVERRGYDVHLYALTERDGEALKEMAEARGLLAEALSPEVYARLAAAVPIEDEGAWRQARGIVHSDRRSEDIIREQRDSWSRGGEHGE